MINLTKRGLSTAIRLAFGLALLADSAMADPVLYRISEYVGDIWFNSVPSPNHPPFTIPAMSPAVASVAMVGTQPASIMVGAGDLVYSNRHFNTNPPVTFGVFYSSQGWKINSKAATLKRDPAAVTVNKQPNGFAALPPYFNSTAPQPAAAFVRVKPGPNKFGGTWDLQHAFDSNQVFQKSGGGFRAGNTVSVQLEGLSKNTNMLAGIFHPTPDPTNPQFSSTQCPTSPATCPWAGNTTPFQAENTGVRFTTGMVTVMNRLPPITFLPASGTITDTGMDNRSGPMSSMGTIQLVSAHNAFGRGALDVQVLSQWDLTLTFLPEPQRIAMLAVGLLVLIMVGLRRRA